MAELAASGMTNRDIAAALFISAKTVEHNLSRAYRKLEIRSRAELGRRIDQLAIRETPIPLTSTTTSVLVMRTAMPGLRCYLAEWYRPEVTERPVDDIAATLDAGAAILCAEGTVVRLLMALAVRSDQVLYGVFAACSPETVRASLSTCWDPCRTAHPRRRCPDKQRRWIDRDRLTTGRTTRFPCPNKGGVCGIGDVPRSAPTTARRVWEGAISRRDASLGSVPPDELPARTDCLEAGLDGLHVAGVVAVAVPAREVLLVQRSQRVVVDLDAQAGCRRHGDGAVLELQSAGLDDLLGLPPPVGVAGLGEVRRGAGEVHHRGQADAEVGVGVHRQPEAEGIADSGDRRERCRPPQ